MFHEPSIPPPSLPPLGSGPAYRILALRLAERTGSTSRYLYLTDPDQQTTIAYYFWVLKGPTETIIVDTGFTPELAEARGIKTYLHTPAEQLHRLGIDRFEVEHVILTHLHWDHLGGLHLFPNATFYVQRRELMFYTGPLVRFQGLGSFVTPEDVTALVELNFKGRVRLLEGAAEVRPGVFAIPVGGHTPGSQIVAVETSKGRAVLSGDAAPLSRNIQELIPSGIFVNLPEFYLGLETIRTTASSPDLIFPSHDPLLSTRYPQAGEGIVLLVGD